MVILNGKILAEKNNEDTVLSDLNIDLLENRIIKHIYNKIVTINSESGLILLNKDGTLSIFKLQPNKLLGTDENSNLTLQENI